MRLFTKRRRIKTCGVRTRARDRLDLNGGVPKEDDLISLLADIAQPLVVVHFAILQRER